MSHFLDRLTFFKKVREPFAGGHGITTDENVTFKSFAAQPGLMPRLLATQARSPTVPFGPML